MTAGAAVTTSLLLALSSGAGPVRHRGAGAPPAPRAPSPAIVCYVETLFGGVSAEGVDLSVCTHVVEAFLLPDPAGAVHPANGLPRRPILDAAHEHGSRVLVAVGGATVPASTFATLAASPERLDRFANALAAFVVRAGYDGVDLDWEFPARGERERQVTLVRAVRARLERAFRTAGRRAPPLLLLGVSPGAALLSYDFPSLAPAVDYFVQFGYDLRNPALGPWASSARLWPDGATEPIEGSVRGVANQLLRLGVPRAKLVIGLPFFASSGRPWVEVRAAALSSRAPVDPLYLEQDVNGAWVTGPAALEAKVRKALSGSELAGGAAAGVALWQLGHQGAFHDLTDAVRRARLAVPPGTEPR